LACVIAQLVAGRTLVAAPWVGFNFNSLITWNQDQDQRLHLHRARFPFAVLGRLALVRELQLLLAN
jgi:hypothetical protein